MKKFKQIDLLVNIILVTGFTGYTLIKWDDSLFLAYFVVGGWQVISMIVHIAGKWFTKRGGPRYAYNWVTGIALLTFPLGSFWLLLFIAPLMAVYYTWQCYDELVVKMRRPLANLK